MESYYPEVLEGERLYRRLINEEETRNVPSMQVRMLDELLKLTLRNLVKIRLKVKTSLNLRYLWDSQWKLTEELAEDEALQD